MRGDVKNQRMLPGFTIIEALVFLFLFSVITLVFFRTFAYGTALIQQSKFRLGAVALANQKMEIVRSLDYENIGTVSGVPAGDITQDEDIQVNNAAYHVHTFIQYVDDTYDGILGGSPNDLIPNDYKRVRIEVSWGDGGDEEKIQLFSTFAPPGIEQPAGGGILSINILNSQGDGVSGANVRIMNSAVSPSIDVTTATDASGNLFLVSAPASSQAYQIIFSKAGYFGSLTYPPFPTSVFVPTDVHASVVNATLNQATFIMDRESSLELQTKDPFGADIPDLSFRIDGGRRIGTVSGLGTPVYEFGENSTTDTNGEKNYTERSYGTYTWTLDSSETGYQFIRLSPEVSAGSNLISLLPGTTSHVEMILADKAINGVAFTVRSTTSRSAINGASVRLSNSALSYDETVVTTQQGKAYFPVSASPGLLSGTYDFEVSLPGYTTSTGTVTVTSGLVNQTVILNP